MTDPRKIVLTTQWKSHRDAADKAFHNNDGAACVGHALAANRIAETYREEFNLSHTDYAVAEMRQIIKWEL